MFELSNLNVYLYIFKNIKDEKKILKYSCYSCVGSFAATCFLSTHMFDC